MNERATLNLSTGDLDVLRRLGDAQRELRELAAEHFNAKTSKAETRRQQGRKLNGIAASLKTVELRLTSEEL